jgi:U3 small nucleolar RNA-associated protein 13
MALCLDKSVDGKLLVSGSKDRTARVWASHEGEYKCIAICEGHAESIGAVAMSRKPDNASRFMFTASQDRTVKMWDLTALSTDAVRDPIKPKSLATLRIHEKDINALDLAPNDRFLASGSQDKLVKVFEVDFSVAASGAAGAIKLLGTCKGHRRGVWTVKFSKTDRIVASGAADRTVRLWNLDDFTCLKVGPTGVQADSRRLRDTQTRCSELISCRLGLSL